MLELSDYRVMTASNGAEALDRIRAQPPAAVLLDLMMPVMDGWEFMERCRRGPPCAGLPIAIMSAAHDAASAASQLGVQGYLTKPFELDAVLAVVDRLATSQEVNGRGVRRTGY